MKKNDEESNRLGNNLRGKCTLCGNDMENEGCSYHGEKLCRSCFIGPDYIHIPIYSSFGPWSLFSR